MSNINELVIKTNGNKENKFNDAYLQEPINEVHSSTKAKNVYYWEHIDGLAQDMLENMASCVGIKILEWGDFDDIKKVVEIVTEIIEERFEVKYPFVEGNY